MSVSSAQARHLETLARATRSAEVYVAELVVSGIDPSHDLALDALGLSLADAIASAGPSEPRGGTLTIDAMNGRHIPILPGNASELGAAIAKAVADALREVEQP